MHSGASLAVFPVVILCAHAALGQSIEHALVKAAADSRDGAAHVGEELSVENRLLKTDCDVALEQARLAHRRVQLALSNPEEVVNIAAVLLENLVAWQQMAQQLGRETPELIKLQLRLAELRVAAARFEVENNRRSHEKIVQSIQAIHDDRPPPLQPPSPPPSTLQLFQALDLANALKALGENQVELLGHVDTGHARKKGLREGLDRLENRMEQFEVKIGKLMEASTPPDIDELIGDAQRLVAEADRLVTRADEIAGTTLDTRTTVVDETRRAMDLTRTVLRASEKLLQEARTERNTEQAEAKLRQLMIRRLALLRDQFQRVHRQAQLGLQVVNWLDIVEASERVLAAELDLCQTREERIARRQQHLDQFRQLEAQVIAEIQSPYSQPTIADPVHIEIPRLRFEIELQRELLRDKSESKSGNAAGEQGKLPR